MKLLSLSAESLNSRYTENSNIWPLAIKKNIRRRILEEEYYRDVIGMLIVWRVKKILIEALL
jgi:hypothetical protein